MRQQASKQDDGHFLEEVKQAVSNIKWGSIEIFIQDSTVVQITERSIKKMGSEKKK